MSTNAQIIDALEKMARLRQAQGQKWNAMAYSRAATAIRNYPKQIESGMEARQIAGINEKIGLLIDELLRTGQVAEVGQLDSEKDAILQLFQTIHGVGPVGSEKWYNLGYRRLEDIPISELTAAQQIGLAFREEFMQRIPRDEIQQLELILHQYLDPLGIQFVIAGSYRRGRAVSGDVDILVVTQPGRNVAQEVLTCPIFTHVLASGPKKVLAVGKIRDIHHRIDLELVPPNEYAYSLVYFTGSQSFNIKMRQRAKDLGYTLNEKGIFGPNNEWYPANSEEDVFRLLGLAYLNPIERDAY